MKNDKERQYWIDKGKEIVKDMMYSPDTLTWKEQEDLLQKRLGDLVDHIEIAILADWLDQIASKVSKKSWELSS